MTVPARYCPYFVRGLSSKRKDYATDEPGTIVAVNKQAIVVATGSGLLDIREIQTANSKRMSVGQFLAGHRVTVGGQLGSSAA